MENTALGHFGRFAERAAGCLPFFINALFIFAVGAIAALLVRSLILRLWRALGIDRIAEKYALTVMLRKGGIKEPVSVLTARAAGWVTFLLFGFLSLWSLEVPAIGRMIERLFFYLPNVFVAGVILLLGYFLSNFMGRAALIAAVNSGSRVSGHIGKAVKYGVFALSATMAFEQMGIGRTAALIAFAVAFGGAVLALSLSFGLGGRDIAKGYIEKKIKGEERKDDIQHL